MIGLYITAKDLQQGYRYHKLQKTFSKFYRKHNELISKFNVGLNTLLREGLSEPGFYGDLVNKYKKLIGRNDFSFQFRKIITRYRHIGCNLNVMRQSASLVWCLWISIMDSLPNLRVLVFDSSWWLSLFICLSLMFH